MLEIKDATISITLSGVEKKFDLNKIFDIDENDLTKEFTSQASVYAYFATAAAEADYEASIGTADQEASYADADKYYRDTLSHKGEKYTEGVIRSMVLLDADYDNAVQDELLAKYNARVLKAIVNAMEMRAQMLMSVGSHIRHELDMTGMNIRERQYNKTVDDVKDTIRSRKSREEV